ncbi:NAD kinase b isoform X2 [Hypomesus transpacificus]|nr:NAD kinase b isoform X2 [Hypomesus transpacificus]XP_046884463.1 NAD kinase b isoform X2 [Hypomesus transpacificus]
MRWRVSAPRPQLHPFPRGVPGRLSSRRSPPRPRSNTASTRPGHHSDSKRESGHSDGKMITNRCSGSRRGRGCQANTSTCWTSQHAPRQIQRRALLREGPTFFMGHILPLTSDPKPVFFPTRPQLCKHRWEMDSRHIQDPASQRLTWNKPPANVLVIRKIRDETLVEPFKELCRFLVEEKGMMVYVERRVVDDATLSQDETFGSIRDQLCTFREGYDDISDCIDLIICLGGDGTLLYASSLFQGSVPPVVAFHLGSLGFLTPFKFESYKTEVAKVFEGNAAITLRSRLKVKVVKDLLQRAHQQQELNGLLPPSHTTSEAGKVTLQLQVLNEVVVDRGPSSYLSNVDLYLNGRLITSVQGDGVIVSTPTGSTAYAAAAGASMIHPNVPAIMVTPICPHSLSFRPIVVPAGVELMITLSPDARNTAWVSFDGRKRQEIQHGDCIKITTSCYPLPSICCHDLVYDWFESLAQCLHWNVRKRQARLADDLSDNSDTEN